MRLTCKYKEDIYVKPEHQESFEWEERCIDKLGQLEDIEEELGVDLVILFKALTKGLYGKFYLENGEPNIIFNSNKFNFIDKEHKCFDSYFSPHPIHLYFKDYGKTWALTREELL